VARAGAGAWRVRGLVRGACGGWSWVLRLGDACGGWSSAGWSSAWAMPMRMRDPSVWAMLMLVARVGAGRGRVGGGERGAPRRAAPGHSPARARPAQGRLAPQLRRPHRGPNGPREEPQEGEERARIGPAAKLVSRTGSRGESANRGLSAEAQEEQEEAAEAAAVLVPGLLAQRVARSLRRFPRPAGPRGLRGLPPHGARSGPAPRQLSGSSADS
jgi:hypothetical protein